MAESEDVSTLIDNEELDQEDQTEPVAFHNLGTSEDILNIQSMLVSNTTNGTWEFVKLQDDSDIPITEASDSIQVLEKSDILKTDKDSEALKEGNDTLEVVKADDDLDKEERRGGKEVEDNKMNQNPDRGSLDLTKYIIKGNANTFTINLEDETVQVHGEPVKETVGTIHENGNTKEINNIEHAPNAAPALAASYSNHTTRAGIVNEPIVVIRGLEENSEVQIQEDETKETQFRITEVPFRKRKIKLLQVFSLVAILLFFPFGIPAAYLASKLEDEFNKGILKGNIDKATKMIKRTETLIILSFIGVFLTVITVFAVLEHHLIEQDEIYLQSKKYPGPHLG